MDLHVRSNEEAERKEVWGSDRESEIIPKLAEYPEKSLDLSLGVEKGSRAFIGGLRLLEGYKIKLAKHVFC